MLWNIVGLIKSVPAQNITKCHKYVYIDVILLFGLYFQKPVQLLAVI